MRGRAGRTNRTIPSLSLFLSYHGHHNVEKFGVNSGLASGPLSFWFSLPNQKIVKAQMLCFVWRICTKTRWILPNLKACGAEANPGGLQGPRLSLASYRNSRMLHVRSPRAGV